MKYGIFGSIYKFVHSVLPCAFITLSVGAIYAFSLFAPHISEALGTTKVQTQFAFSLSIFFLGLGAAFFGPLVEKRIKTAATVSTVLFFLGLVTSGLGIRFKNIWLVYLGTGLFCGLAEGCGYVVPVKNLILWYSKSRFKGVIMAVSIISFGLGSTVCSWMFDKIVPRLGIECGYYAFAGIYLAAMLLGVFFVRKPFYATSKLAASSDFKVSSLFADGFFWKAWTFMFLNISMGLILIGSCASIIRESGLKPELVITVMMLCGLFNGGGRLVFPFISDFLKKRINVLYITLAVEIILMAVGAAWYSLIPWAIVGVNACYGSFFACLPSILRDHYGVSRLSTIHGAVLSSWGFAALFAFACLYVMSLFTQTYYFLAFVLLAVYVLNLFVVRSASKSAPVE